MKTNLMHAVTKSVSKKFKKIYPNSVFFEHYQLLKLVRNNAARNKNYPYLQPDALLGLKNKNERLFESNVSFILSLSFSKSNTNMAFLTSSGTLLFSTTSGLLNFKGNQKTNRQRVLKQMLTELNITLKKAQLEKVPICLQLTKVGTFQSQVVNLTKRFFLISSIKTFNRVPYNGCRKKKIRRKKFKQPIIR